MGPYASHSTSLILAMRLCVCSVMSDSAAPWTVVCQIPLSMELSWQEYWNGLPLPTPGALPDSGIEPESLASPALAVRFFTTAPPWKPVPWHI